MLRAVTLLPLLLASCFLIGFGQGIGQFYRFAVVEVCAPLSEASAVALVITGGCFAAFAGPTGSTLTRTLLPVDFAASYVFVAALGFTPPAVGAEVVLRKRLAKLRGAA